MDTLLLFPIIWPLLAAAIGLTLPRTRLHLRNGFVWAVLFLELLCIALLCSGGNAPLTASIGRVLGVGLHFGADGFRLLYAFVSAFLFLMAGLFTPWYLSHSRNRRRYDCTMLLTLAGVVGVFLSDDLFTLFLFFELMSFSSYFLVLHEQTPDAMQAAKTYLAVSVAGGLLLLLGILLLQGVLGSTAFSSLQEATQAYRGSSLPLFLAGGCMLLGFGAKAGMFPVHFWLPGAHAASPAPASALLSGILTKTGVFGILVLATRVFHETMQAGVLLALLGAAGMLLGAVRALFSVDLKRALAFSSVSQIGFILLGVGLQITLGSHNALAVRGTVLHMLNHSLIKLVLFLLAGVVLHNTHSLHLSEVQGFGRGKPLFTFAFLMGAAGLSGVPFWNGYVSKTLLHDAILEQVAGGHFAQLFQGIEWLFLLAGGITCAYMTKLFIALCVQKPRHTSEAPAYSYLNPLGKAVLLTTGLLPPLLGLNAGFMMDSIGSFAQDFLHGHAPAHAPLLFSWHAMQGSLLSLTIGAVIYLLFVRRVLMRKSADGSWQYLSRWPAWLELETLFYRPLVKTILPAIGGVIAAAVGNAPDLLGGLVWRVFLRLRVYWAGRTAGKPKNIREQLMTERARLGYTCFATRLQQASGRLWPGARKQYAVLNARMQAHTAGASARLRKRYARFSQAWKNETQPFWEGEGEVLSGMKTAHTRKQAQAAELPDSNPSDTE